MLRNLIKSNQKFIKHGAFSYFVILFNIASSIYTVKHNIHLLQKENYGLWIITFSIISLMSLFNLGFNSILIFKFDEFKKNNNTSYIFSSNVFVLIIQLTLTSFSLVSIYFFVSKFIVASDKIIDFKDLLLLMFPGLILSSISSFFEAVLFYNFRQIYFKNVLELIRLGGLNLSFIFGLYIWQDIRILGIMYSLIATFVFFYVLVRFKKLQVLEFKIENINTNYFKNNFKNSFSFWIISLSSIVITQTDTLFISTVKNDLGLVTIYSQSFRLQEIALRFIKKITEIKGPKILALYRDKKFESLIKIYKQLFALNLLISIIAFILISFFGKLILEYWLNSEIIFDQTLISTLGLLCISGSLHWVIWNFATITEQQKAIKNAAIIEIILNLCLSYFLLMKYGILGLGIASIISNSFTIIYGILLFKKFQKKKINQKL